VAAFLCYHQTLLPGLDLGDSASFQTIAGSLTLNPRQAYPLYFGLGNLFVWLHPGEPARAINLASAVYGGMAVGLAAWLTAKLTESLAGGIGAGLFLAFSYTFWSQAVTAEVYTLHLMMVGGAGVAALAWADRPTPGRLALFYGLFAAGFGNHLSMVLLLPAFAVFLLMHRRSGPGDPLRPRMLLTAAGLAALGALQYAWNLRGLWAELEPPATLSEAFTKFWFDVTKEDWRETLVNTVSETGLMHRPSMYWFDLRQQVGIPGVVLALLGFCYVLWRWPRRAIFLLLFYAVNMAFAWTYNVGDAYIFFLPSHYVVALCAGAGVAAAGAFASRLSNRTIANAASAILLLYPAWRGYDTWPAVDRSWDTRAEQVLDEFTARRLQPLAPTAIYGFDTNWQLQNAVEYYMRERMPGIPWFLTEQFQWFQGGGRLQRFDRFLRDNTEFRRVLATRRIAEQVIRRPPGAQLIDPEPMRFSERIRVVRVGTPYVIAVLRPDREYPLNNAALADAWQWLAPGVSMPAVENYTVAIGRVGHAPALLESQNRPFRRRVAVDGVNIDVRLESWLPTDTIRRAGFGHAIVDRKHVLTFERGISFVALGPDGGLFYESGLYAPLARWNLQPTPAPPIPNP
jgi:hypothetical protein